MAKDGVPGKDGKAGIARPKPDAPGKDGADVVAAFRDSDRHLILTLSNGVVKDIGQIHGENGKDGAPGLKMAVTASALMISELSMMARKRSRSISCAVMTKKTFTFVTPLIIYRGIWRQGKYLKGDAATSEGSMFVAKAGY